MSKNTYNLNRNDYLKVDIFLSKLNLFSVSFNSNLEFHISKEQWEDWTCLETCPKGVEETY